MEGYAKLSSLISTDSDFAVYRKFAALNAQNLLYYQAELMGLEADLRDIASEEMASQDPSKRLYADNWFELSNEESGESYQWQKFRQVRRTLKEYSSPASNTANERRWLMF
ncbi:hypothetical protein MMC28_002094 [Mycoblastus sanguinarius]|nr:hypothetical protein [Mycoblastus sanguinarius]